MVLFLITQLFTDPPQFPSTLHPYPFFLSIEKTFPHRNPIKRQTGKYNTKET